MTIEADEVLTPVGHIERQRQQWEALLGEIHQMDTELAKHQAERARLDAALDAATLESDALELAAKKIRRDLLARESSRLERAIFRARQEEERLGGIVAQYDGKLSMAWAIVNDLRSVGLRQRQLYGVEIGDLIRKVDRSREIIRAAGEGDIGPITFEL